MMPAASSAVFRRRARPSCRVAGRRGEHVAVLVGVVGQHRQNGGAPRAHAEGVVDGLGRVVLLGALGQGLRFAGLGRVVLVGGVLVRLRGDVSPVLDQHELLVGQPHRALGDVVEDDGVPVDAEDGGGGGGELLVVPGLDLARALAQELARSGPCGVHAVAQAHRGGGHAVGGLAVVRGGQGRRSRAVHAHVQQSGAGGHQDGVGGRARLLKSQARFAQVEGLPAGQVDHSRAALQDDGLLPDGGHGDVRAGCQRC